MRHVYCAARTQCDPARPAPPRPSRPRPSGFAHDRWNERRQGPAHGTSAFHEGPMRSQPLHTPDSQLVMLLRGCFLRQRSRYVSSVTPFTRFFCGWQAAAAVGSREGGTQRWGEGVRRGPQGSGVQTSQLRGHQGGSRLETGWKLRAPGPWARRCALRVRGGDQLCQAAGMSHARPPGRPCAPPAVACAPTRSHAHISAAGCRQPRSPVACISWKALRLARAY
jgi:hypothetical protein